MPDAAASNADFVSMLSSSDQTRIVKVSVYNENGIWLVDLPEVTAGAVTADITATTRRTLTLTVVDKGVLADPDNSMVPVLPDTDPTAPSTQWASLLNPLSGNELYVYRGFAYADGTEDLCQLGVFRMTKPNIVDQGTDIQITITGNDRSWQISKYKWRGAYQINSGTKLEDAVVGVLERCWNSSQAAPLDYSGICSTISLTNPSGILLPTTTYGADLANSNDPWADITGLVNQYGYELYFDPTGRPIMKPIPNPKQVGPSFIGVYQEGVTCTMTHLESALDETNTFSGVIAIGNGTGNGMPPVMSNMVSPTDGKTYPGVWNTDPDSPTYFDPGNPDASDIGPVAYIFETQAIPGSGDTGFSAQQKINSAASQQLQLILSEMQSPDLECVPNPALWEEDVIPITRARDGIDAHFMVQSTVIPLDVSTAQTVTLKPQAAVAA